MFRAIIFFSVTLLAGVSCTSTDPTDPLLKEAIQFHTEATEIQATLEPRIEQIDSLKTRLANRPEPMARKTVFALDSLKKAFEDWEANLVEVPGMPHEHHHKHGKHDHHPADATLKDLPAGQMRDLQKETRDNIQQLQKRTEAVLKQAQILVH